MTDKTRLGASIAILVVIIIILGVIFSAFLLPEGEETIKVGIILPLSGSAAYYGQVSRQGIEIAREEIASLYPNLNIEVYYEDSFYTPKGGVDAYNKLRNIDQVDAVITAASQVSLAVQPLSQRDGVLQMAIFSSANKYTTPNDLSFRVSNRNEIEAAKMAGFIKSKNFQRLGIIYLNNDFGVGFKDSLKEELERVGNHAEIIGEEGCLLDTTDFRTHLSKLEQHSPDAVFMVGIASQYGLILKQAREMGIVAQFLSMRSAEDPNLLANAGEAANGLIYTYPFDASSNGSEIKRFAAAYETKYNKIPDAYAAEGYEGFRLTVMAFGECGRDYGCIKNYLNGLEGFKSVFGDLDFDGNGDVHYGFFLKTVKNGEFVPYGG